MIILKIFGKIFAVAYCMIIVGIIQIFTVLSVAANFVNGDFYYDMLQNINLSEINITLLGDDNLIKKYGDKVSVEDVIIQELGEYNIAPEDVKSLLNNQNVKKYLGDVVNAFIDEEFVDSSASLKVKESINNLLNEPDVKKVLDQLDLTVDNDEIIEYIEDYLRGLGLWLNIYLLQIL